MTAVEVGLVVVVRRLSAPVMCPGLRAHARAHVAASVMRRKASTLTQPQLPVVISTISSSSSSSSVTHQTAAATGADAVYVTSECPVHVRVVSDDGEVINHSLINHRNLNLVLQNKSLSTLL